MDNIMTKHTPGALLECHRGDDYVAIYGDGHREVALLTHPSKAAVANFTLMAAAPTLLTAAILARSQFGVFMIGHGTAGWSCCCGALSLGDDPLPHKPGCVIPILDAAIAKACSVDQQEKTNGNR